MLERNQKSISIKKEKEILMEKPAIIFKGDDKLKIIPFTTFPITSGSTEDCFVEIKIPYDLESYKELKKQMDVEQEITIKSGSTEYVYNGRVVQVLDIAGEIILGFTGSLDIWRMLE